jgi:pimeloyl-ACP methyl ester carboxylesterase
MDRRQESPNTIVLIHGLWMTPLSWEDWIDHYGYRGYRVLAPAWPGMDTDIERLRADPSGIENLGIEDIVDHYDGIIRGLDEPPIVIGHSFGGAFTEILLDRGLGAAGVAIDAAAVRISSSTHLRMPCPPRSRSGPTSGTRSPAPGGCCGRAHWPTSTLTPRTGSTSTTTIGRRCY